MNSSERLLTAIGDISDEKIEKTALTLGYSKNSRSVSNNSAGVRRLLLIAAVITMIIALCASAYAIYVHWTRGMERLLPATEAEKQLAEESGLSDTSRSVSATANGVTVSVEQTVIDSHTAWIALRIEGLQIERERQWDATLWNCSLTFDGERPPAWGASFASEHDENGDLILSAADGSLEYDIWARAGDKLETLAGREIRITIESMGTGGLKSDYLPLAEGPWELVWTPSSNSKNISVQPDAMIGDTGVRLISAEISPITAKVTMKLPQPWEGYEVLELFDLQLTGVRLKDGTVVVSDIFGPPSSWGYEDINNLIFVQEYSSHKIIRPEQVDALIFAENFPWARSLTEDELIIVPIS